MSIVEELQDFVDSNNLMGAWVQKGKHITHITKGLEVDIALNFGSLGISVLEYYDNLARTVESFLFGYDSGQLLFVKLRASLIGIALPTEFELLDELVEEVRKTALKATLELLQAKPIATIAEKEANPEDPNEVNFTRWEEFLGLARTECTRLLHASQVDTFIEMQLKEYKPQTITDSFKAVQMIVSGIPDKSKKELLLKALTERLNELI